MKLEINEHEQYMLCSAMLDQTALRIERMEELIAAFRRGEMTIGHVMEQLHYRHGVVTEYLELAIRVAPSKEWRDVASAQMDKLKRISSIFDGETCLLDD